MKRSDMVKHLASELILAWLDIYPTQKNLPGFDKAQELTDRILARAEKEGMCLVTVDECENLRSLMWEPEDENKN